MTADDFRPALLVVDLQEDFCPPDGSLAVVGGRDIIQPVNKLLASSRFALRVATKDWHPADHISFATNHPGKKPFVDTVTIANPLNASETLDSRLWPVHCVQGSKGADLVAGLDVARIDRILEKGQDSRVEMYSPFYAPFSSPAGIGDSGLAALLREHGVTHVYVTGLAGDYCVRAAAVDAAREGFHTFLVEECTRAVDAEGWPACRRGIEDVGVRVVSMDGPEVARVMAA